MNGKFGNGKRLLFLAAGVGLGVLAVCMARRPAINAYPVTRVSVILPHNDDGYWSLIREGIEEGDMEWGGRYNIDIKFFVPQLNYNIPQMTEALRQQVAAKVDVVVVQGNEDPEFQAVLEEAREEGTEIICMDTPFRDFPYDLYVGTDNRAAGQLIGQELAALTEGRADVAVILGAEGYLNLEERLEGFEEALEPYPDIRIQSVCYDQYDGLTFMQLYHSQSREANMLVCLEGTGGLALSHTYTERDDEYQVIVGFDSYEGVESGVLDGIVKQDTRQMVQRIVEEIAGFVETGRYSARDIYTDIIWLTSENYDEVMNE